LSAIIFTAKQGNAVFQKNASNRHAPSSQTKHFVITTELEESITTASPKANKKIQLILLKTALSNLYNTYR